jgi:hypothetical protein
LRELATLPDAFPAVERTGSGGHIHLLSINTTDIYALRRFRPFALRLLITALPAFVLILLRNPWVRFLLILLG